MKFINLIKTAFLFIMIISFDLAHADSSGLGITCLIDGQPTLFKKEKSSYSSIILREKATINDEAYLSGSYNISYDIGGSLKLISREMHVTLLIWDNGFSPDTRHGKIEYKGLIIECFI